MRTMALAEFIVMALGLYVAVGIVFAIFFVTLGVARVDPAARGAPWGFRLIILPGTVALWPIMLLKFIRGGAPS